MAKKIDFNNSYSMEGLLRAFAGQPPQPQRPPIFVEEKDGEPMMRIGFTQEEINNGSEIVFETVAEDITIRGVLNFNNGKIYKVVDGELVEDGDSGETTLD